MTREKKKPMKREDAIKLIENLILAAVFLVCAYLIYNYLFSNSIIESILKGIALISIFAMGESIVLACGGIDLSIASTGLLSSSIVFYMVEKNISGVSIAILAGIAISGCIGLINGLLIAKVKVHPVIVTMATALFAYGVSGAITNNIVLFDTCGEFAFLKSVSISVIPVSLIIAVVILLCCFSLFKYTVIGRQVFAVGGSESSAKLSGLNVERIKMWSYGGAGVLAGIGGMMVLADSAQAARFFAAGADLEVVFAAIIGGVSLYSGARIFFRAFIGASMIAIINRIIYGLFVFNYMRAIIVGLLVLLVIALRRNLFKREKTGF